METENSDNPMIGTMLSARGIDAELRDKARKAIGDHFGVSRHDVGIPRDIILSMVRGNVDMVVLIDGLMTTKIRVHQTVIY